MDIYAYDDFRAFLRDAFQARKESDPAYSHRKFAREAGFANPGFLNDVIKGLKPLGLKAAEKMAAAFQLKQNEADYFKLLVEFGQAKSEETKEEAHRKILFRRSRSSFTRLNPAMARYYQDPAYSLVRNAAAVLDFRGDYEALGKFLYPPMAPSLVKRVVRELCAWGLLKQDSKGRYHVTSSLVEPAPTMMGLSRMANAEWLGQAKDAVHRLPKEKRHVSTMILHVSDALHRRIEEKIERFRKEIFEMAESDEAAQRIIQLTVAYIPKSRPLPDGEGGGR